MLGSAPGVYTIQRILKRAPDHWELGLQLVSVSLWDSGTNSGSSGTKLRYQLLTRLSCLELTSTHLSVQWDKRRGSCPCPSSSPAPLKAAGGRFPFALSSFYISVALILPTNSPSWEIAYGFVTLVDIICFLKGLGPLYGQCEKNVVLIILSGWLDSRQVKFYYVWHL